jgi:serine/threonine-protein kinase
MLELDRDLATVERGGLPAVAANGVPLETGTTPGAACAVFAPGLWTAEELRHLEGALAHSVGPMARVLVVRATQTGGTREEILDRLGQQIPAAAARQKFLDTFRNRMRTPTPRSPTPRPAAPGTPAPGASARPPSGADAAAPAISAEDTEALRALLADRIGPLAGVLVRRAVARAQGRDALLAELADHVPAGPGRASFLAAAARRLPAS